MFALMCDLMSKLYFYKYIFSIDLYGQREFVMFPTESALSLQENATRMRIVPINSTLSYRMFLALTLKESKTLM